jgi:serine/threonine-protein kinase
MASTFNQGRYQVQRLLGKGGMGAVYLARDDKFGNLVAIKENLDVSAGARQQFEFEARILANLSHPCLPHVFDSFVEPSGRQYLVMEYIGGDDLEELLGKRGSLSEAEVIAWARDICAALAHMHGRKPDPVIHRDIKPANIKITPGGQAKLVDFGIAKEFRAGQKTVNAARAATSGYSPPEQYGLGTDARSDIYALGATMYHLLTGQAPPDSIAIMPARPLEPPRRLNPGLSQQVEQVILKAMALNPSQRYQAATEMDQELAAITGSAISCPQCGHSNRSGAKFCSACGKRLVGATPPMACVNCGLLNRASARMCAGCGQPLAAQKPAAVQVSPATPAALRSSEHRIAAWTLLGLGVVSLFAFWLWPGAWLMGGAATAAGVAAAVLAMIAARDLLELGASYRYALPSYLLFLMGSQQRGRRLGILAACILALLFIGQAWTILPLLPVAIAVYIVSILTSREAILACGGRYDRPAGATLLGWGLVFSGIGTLPGIGLLIPQPWARRGAMAALVVLAALGSLAVVATVLWGFAAPANSTPLAREVAFSLLGGAAVRSTSLAATCYALVLIAASTMGIRYLHRSGSTLVATPASVQREVSAAAWMLLGLGLFLLIAPYTLWTSSRWGLFPRELVILTGLLCLVAARDLAQWFQTQSRSWPAAVRVLIGSTGRGRVLGIVGALVTAVILLGLAWLIVPLALAIAVFYVIEILISRAVAARCGANVSIPPKAALIAWLLIPTGIGALPGIAMLTPRPWARKAGVATLACLLALGLALMTLAIIQGVEAPAGSSYLANVARLPLVGLPVRANALTAGAYGLEIVIACGLAIRYLQRADLRTFYGA